MDEKLIYNIAFIIVVVAAINTGIHGLINVDLLFQLFTNLVGRIVEILIGAGGVYITLKQFNIIK